MKLRLMTLSGKFAFLRDVEVSSHDEAFKVATEHATSGGYTNVKAVPDADEIRYTARTPGGRGGRNIGYVDLWE